jgi:hypothetical protein
MPVYEIINPSDAYTIRGELRHAAIATLFLGDGKYGLTDADGNQAMPLFVLGGLEAWLVEKGIAPDTFTPGDWAAVADAADSVLIGGFRDRADAEAATSRMTPGDAAAYLAERQDRRRSSMNDIGASAKSLAAKIRAKHCQAVAS